MPPDAPQGTNGHHISTTGGNHDYEFAHKKIEHSSHRAARPFELDVLNFPDALILVTQYNINYEKSR